MMMSLVLSDVETDELLVSIEGEDIISHKDKVWMEVGDKIILVECNGIRLVISTE